MIAGPRPVRTASYSWLRIELASREIYLNKRRREEGITVRRPRSKDSNIRSMSCGAMPGPVFAIPKQCVARPWRYLSSGPTGPRTMNVDIYGSSQ